MRSRSPSRTAARCRIDTPSVDCRLTANRLELRAVEEGRQQRVIVERLVETGDGAGRALKRREEIRRVGGLEWAAGKQRVQHQVRPASVAWSRQTPLPDARLGAEPVRDRQRRQGRLFIVGILTSQDRGGEFRLARQRERKILRQRPGRQQPVASNADRRADAF